ncbi:MAG: hypothetical protein ABIH59_00050 [archaeon]
MIKIIDPEIGEEEKKAVLEVLESGMIAQGPKTKESEVREIIETIKNIFKKQ